MAESTASEASHASTKSGASRAPTVGVDESGTVIRGRFFYFILEKENPFVYVSASIVACFPIRGHSRDFTIAPQTIDTKFYIYCPAHTSGALATTGSTIATSSVEKRVTTHPPIIGVDEAGTAIYGALPPRASHMIGCIIHQGGCPCYMIGYVFYIILSHNGRTKMIAQSRYISKEP